MKVSIIVPIFNYPGVVKALDSIPRRDDIEVIAINDCSTDNTIEVLNQYQETHKDLNLTVLSNEENGGLGFTKNRGFNVAKGDYVYQLDNDDWLYPDIFEQALEELDGTDLVYVSPQINDNSVYRLTPETKGIFVAGFTRFIRREFMGDKRTKEDDWQEDLYFHNLLQTFNPTEKFTDLVPYHYNWPREGSICWNLDKGIAPNKT